MTNQQKLEQISQHRDEAVKDGNWEKGFYGYVNEKDFDWLLALASAFLELKEGLKSGKLTKEWESQVEWTKYLGEPDNFANWLLTKLEEK